MFELRRPTTGLHKAWLECHREWGDGLHEDGFGVRSGDDLEDPAVFAEWVRWLLKRPARMWWIVEDGEVLGGIALRPEAVTSGRTTGHIGYGICPSARGRGVASWALNEVLARAGAAGMSGCLLVCREDNLASIKTIERAGGELLRTLVDDHGRARHYWIPTR